MIEQHLSTGEVAQFSLTSLPSFRNTTGRSLVGHNILSGHCNAYFSLGILFGTDWNMGTGIVLSV
jgi:hypothetical protein